MKLTFCFKVFTKIIKNGDLELKFCNIQCMQLFLMANTNKIQETKKLYTEPIPTIPSTNKCFCVFCKQPININNINKIDVEMDIKGPDPEIIDNEEISHKKKKNKKTHIRQSLSLIHI